MKSGVISVFKVQTKNKHYSAGIEIKVINLMSFDIDDINLLIGVYFVIQLYMADDRHFPKSHMYFFCMEFKKFGLMSCIFLHSFFF